MPGWSNPSNCVCFKELDKHEHNYGISELETLGLVLAVRYFQPYILGHHMTVYMDHAACTSLLKTARPSGKLARWALAIQEMNLTIRLRPGKKNANADALSPNPAVLVGVVEADRTGISGEVVTTGEAARSVVGASDEIMSGSGLVEESEECDETEGSGECGDEVVAEPTPEKLLEIRELQQQDSSLVVRCRYLEHGQLPDRDQESQRLVLESRSYEVMQGVLYYEPPTVPGRLCVVVPETLRVPLLQEAHATNLAGHFAFRRVYDKIRHHYWWNGLRSDVHKFCRSCLVCTSRRVRVILFRIHLHQFQWEVCSTGLE